MNFSLPRFFDASDYIEFGGSERNDLENYRPYAGQALFLIVQAIRIQQEIERAHHNDPVFILPRLDIVFDENEFFERVLNVEQRLRLLSEFISDPGDFSAVDRCF